MPRLLQDLYKSAEAKLLQQFEYYIHNSVANNGYVNPESFILEPSTRTLQDFCYGQQVLDIIIPQFQPVYRVALLNSGFMYLNNNKTNPDKNSYQSSVVNLVIGLAYSLIKETPSLYENDEFMTVFAKDTSNFHAGYPEFTTDLTLDPVIKHLDTIIRRSTEEYLCDEPCNATALKQGMAAYTDVMLEDPNDLFTAGMGIGKLASSKEPPQKDTTNLPVLYLSEIMDRFSQTHS